jgi:hypothetical protein
MIMIDPSLDPSDENDAREPSYSSPEVETLITLSKVIIVTANLVFSLYEMSRAQSGMMVQEPDKRMFDDNGYLTSSGARKLFDCEHALVECMEYLCLKSPMLRESDRKETIPIIAQMRARSNMMKDSIGLLEQLEQFGDMEPHAS